MNLLLVHPHPDLPSSRIRVVRMAEHLEARGATCEVATWPSNARERSALAARTHDRDAVVVHYKLPSFADGRLWRRFQAPIVFDFDDAIRFRQRPKRGSFDSGTRRRRFARMVDRADAFACGNRYLASLVEARGRPLHVVPSAVPVDVPRHEPAGGARPLRIGWVGGSGNLPSLDPLRPVLADLARERDVTLVVIADAPYPLEGCPSEHVVWTLGGQEAALAELDVGIMPLHDDPWTRGKCAYKLLQYMAAGVPVVASPVGMNAELVRDGENGLLAATPDEWRAALARLADEPDLRRRLGAAGRATVVEGYSYTAVADRWFALLDELRA